MMDLRLINPSDVLDNLLNHSIFIGRHNFDVNGELLIEAPAELAGGLICRGNLSVGAFSYSWSTISTSVKSIGRYCSIAGEVRFAEVEHPTKWLSTSSFVYERSWMWGRFAASKGLDISQVPVPHFTGSPKITIGNDVWIGLGAYIRGGVHLGDGCIVAARAVVTRDVPPYAIVAGNPGRVIKFRFDQATIDRLLRLKWWNYSFTDFPLRTIDNVLSTLDDLERRRDSGELQVFSPKTYRLQG